MWSYFLHNVLNWFSVESNSQFSQNPPNIVLWSSGIWLHPKIDELCNQNTCIFLWLYAMWMQCFKLHIVGKQPIYDRLSNSHYGHKARLLDSSAETSLTFMYDLTCTEKRIWPCTHCQSPCFTMGLIIWVLLLIFVVYMWPMQCKEKQLKRCQSFNCNKLCFNLNYTCRECILEYFKGILFSFITHIV